MVKKPANVANLKTGVSLQDLILHKIPINWDPVDLDHVIQIDKNLAKQIMVQRLETQAEINRSIADGASKAAKILR